MLGYYETPELAAEAYRSACDRVSLIESEEAAKEAMKC
jgi:hypothetical protein